MPGQYYNVVIQREGLIDVGFTLDAREWQPMSQKDVAHRLSEITGVDERQIRVELFTPEDQKGWHCPSTYRSTDPADLIISYVLEGKKHVVQIAECKRVVTETYSGWKHVHSNSRIDNLISPYATEVTVLRWRPLASSAFKNC